MVNHPPNPRPVRAGVLLPHRALRELYRHYLEFRTIAMNGGDHVIEHSYLVPDENGQPVWTVVGPKSKCGWVNVRKITISMSFWDLHRGLSSLAPRKREAIFYNVILDQKQKDVAQRMKITTVSVGQYVEAGFKQLAKIHFPEDEL